MRCSCCVQNDASTVRLDFYKELSLHDFYQYICRNHHMLESKILGGGSYLLNAKIAHPNQIFHFKLLALETVVKIYYKKDIEHIIGTIQTRRELYESPLQCKKVKNQNSVTTRELMR